MLRFAAPLLEPAREGTTLTGASGGGCACPEPGPSAAQSRIGVRRLSCVTAARIVKAPEFNTRFLLGSLADSDSPAGQSAGVRAQSPGPRPGYAGVTAWVG